MSLLVSFPILAHPVFKCCQMLGHRRGTGQLKLSKPTVSAQWALYVQLLSDVLCPKFSFLLGKIKKIWKIKVTWTRPAWMHARVTGSFCYQPPYTTQNTSLYPCSKKKPFSSCLTARGKKYQQTSRGNRYFTIYSYSEAITPLQLSQVASERQLFGFNYPF